MSHNLEERGRSIVATASKKIRPVEYIRSELRLMDAEDLLDLAVAYLLAQVKQSQRARVRDIERDAQDSALTLRAPAADVASSRLLMVAPGAPPPTVAREEIREEWLRNNSGNPAALRAYDEGMAREQERLDKIAERVAAKDREREESYRLAWAKVDEAFSRLKNELRMEWTSELLGSEFALGDGTTTTWGDATREQHLLRMALHKRNAVAGMEGYARHAAALEEIERTGSANLREALTVTALKP